MRLEIADSKNINENVNKHTLAKMKIHDNMIYTSANTYFSWEYNIILTKLINM